MAKKLKVNLSDPLDVKFLRLKFKEIYDIRDDDFIHYLCIRYDVYFLGVHINEILAW